MELPGKLPMGIPLNKQTKKLTNKHFINPIYLSQINLDLHEFFRVYSCGCPKMIKIKKNKQVNKQTNKQTNN